jgi:hypothetical protein
MFDARELKSIMGKLETTIESVEHQAVSLEEDNFEAMWDCNDMDNWTSMESNLIDVKHFLERLKNDTTRSSN